MSKRWWQSIGLLGLVLAGGCDSEASRQLVEQRKANEQLESQKASLATENEQLKARIGAMEAQILELSNTPDRRLSEISRLLMNRDEGAALAALESLRSKFPQAPEVLEAEQRLAEHQATIREERKAAERKERLGFKILKEVKSFTSYGITVGVSQPQITGRWTFDSYGHEYRYNDAERGNRFVVVRLSVTADEHEKDPALPGLGLYEVSGKTLKNIGDLRYRFVRWKSFATYLGNYADNGNDFAHTATIPFTAGIQVPSAKAAAPLFLIAARAKCVTRNYRRFDNPPVSYIGYCGELKSELTIDEAIGNGYAVLKIWNADKL